MGMDMTFIPFLLQLNKKNIYTALKRFRKQIVHCKRHASNIPLKVANQTIEMVKN